MAWRCEIVPGSSEPIYAQIVLQARKALLAGVLKPGHQLPTVRALAARLLVNPNTVARAYSELIHLGLLESQGSRGVFVAQARPSLSPEEKNKRLQEASSQFANQVADLGFSQNEIFREIKEQLAKFQKPEKNP